MVPIVLIIRVGAMDSSVGSRWKGVVLAKSGSPLKSSILSVTDHDEGIPTGCAVGVAVSIGTCLLRNRCKHAGQNGLSKAGVPRSKGTETLHRGQCIICGALPTMGNACAGVGLYSIIHSMAWGDATHQPSRRRTFIGTKRPSPSRTQMVTIDSTATRWATAGSAKTWVR